MNSLNQAIRDHFHEYGDMDTHQFRIWEEDGEYYCTPPTTIMPDARRVHAYWHREEDEYQEL